MSEIGQAILEQHGVLNQHGIAPSHQAAALPPRGTPQDLPDHGTHGPHWTEVEAKFLLAEGQEKERF